MRLLIVLGILALGLGDVARAQTAKPLTAAETTTLRETLTKLNEVHHQIASMVSECSGGEIMVLACPAPRPAAANRDGCVEALVSCDVVAALKATDLAIDHITKALGN